MHRPNETTGGTRQAKAQPSKLETQSCVGFDTDNIIYRKNNFTLEHIILSGWVATPGLSL